MADIGINEMNDEMTFDYTFEKMNDLFKKIDTSETYTLDEKNKLAGLENYDDTALKAEITANSEAVATETASRQETDSRLTAETALNRSTLGYQRKNLLKNTAVSNTVNGVTFTVNDDGSVTANGTATKTAIFTLSKINLTVGKKYTLSGCPTGGSSDTFKLFGVDTKETGVDGTDYGIGDTFTSKFSNVQYHIVIYAGHTASNLTFYPMLRYAEITDDTYEPYKPSVEERLAALEAAITGGGEA